jgi:hypothetical protein
MYKEIKYFEIFEFYNLLYVINFEKLIKLLKISMRLYFIYINLKFNILLLFFIKLFIKLIKYFYLGFINFKGF